MPNFTDPYQGNIKDFEYEEDLMNALKLDLMAEMDAVFLYDTHIQSTNDERVIKVLSTIRDEEKVHIGELTNLIYFLLADDDELFDEIELYNRGVEEVYDLLEESLILVTKNRLRE
jgi:rubrerythrin